jgi:hypothetical protein
MDECVRTIYLFKLSNRNTGSYSHVYCICCEAIDALNELNIKPRKSKKSFKYPKMDNKEEFVGIRGRIYTASGNTHKKFSNMIKEKYPWIDS